MLLKFLLLILQCYCLHFYLEGLQRKCFTEKLEAETVVLGNYKIKQIERETRGSKDDKSTNGVQIVVSDSNEHVIIKQTSETDGRFFFTTTQAGFYTICFQSTSKSWVSGFKTRMELELLIGKEGVPHITSPVEADLSQFAIRVNEANVEVAVVAREHQKQHEIEAEFKEQSDRVRSHLFWWTIVQLTIIGLTCLWQMRNLKKFFQAKKLV